MFSATAVVIEGYTRASGQNADNLGTSSEMTILLSQNAVLNQD
jgi:outer membrane protein OmpA-like peptidoglycan-associated protein